MDNSDSESSSSSGSEFSDVSTQSEASSEQSTKSGASRTPATLPTERPSNVKTNELKTYAQTLAEKIILKQKQVKQQQMEIEKEMKRRQKEEEKATKQRQKEEEKAMKQQEKRQPRKTTQIVHDIGRPMQIGDEITLHYLSQLVDDHLKSYHGGNEDSKKEVLAVLNDYIKMGLIRQKQKTDIMKLFK